MSVRRHIVHRLGLFPLSDSLDSGRIAFRLIISLVKVRKNWDNRISSLLISLRHAANMRIHDFVCLCFT